MEFTEFDLGARCHCCKRHDYLPLICGGCGKNFCSKHFHIGNHDCMCVKTSEEKKDDAPDSAEFESAGSGATESSSVSASGSSKRRKKKKLPKCKKKGCRRRDVIPFTCKCCNKSFCSTHRLPKYHDCPGHLAEMAGQQLREKHAAMLMSDEAKKLAKLIQSVRA